MANVSVGGTILTFPAANTDGLDGTVEAAPIEYLLARERAERTAAKTTQSIAARRVHQELAQLYARQRRANFTNME
jgi:hypothetical protein